MKRLAGIAAACAATAATAVLAASVGGQAPDFTLPDAHGNPVKLSDHRGQYVVLEWVNPGCPFVQKHYDSGNMPRLQKTLGGAELTWLAISSTHPEHQDYKSGPQMLEWLKAKNAAPEAMLMDADGEVGRLYGAKTTPHMFVIDPEGKLIYAGAIDDKRSADPKDVKTANNYVQAALTEARAGRPVSQPSTTAYGCAIKYKS